MAFSHLFLLNSLFLLNFSVPGGAFRLQGVGVKGTLLCNGAFSVHTNAAIFDVDRNPGDADDLLDKGHSDRKGRFVLEGTTRELTNIEPELRIIHDCADGIKVGGYAGGDGKDAFGGGGGMFSRLELLLEQKDYAVRLDERNRMVYVMTQTLRSHAIACL